MLQPRAYVTAAAPGDTGACLFSTFHSSDETVCTLNADAYYLSDILKSHRLIDDTSVLVSVILPAEVSIVPPSFASAFHCTGRFCQMLVYRDRAAEAIDLVRETLRNLMD